MPEEFCTTDEFCKRSTQVPADFFAVEAAGLSWLAATDTVRVAGVRGYDATCLRLERIAEAAPSRGAAADFGTRLAGLHMAAAPDFGTPPPGAPTSYFGPLAQPLVVPTAPSASWGEAYARRLEALAAHSSAVPAEVSGLIDRIGAGVFDDTAAPARVHGDLWAGNLLFTADTGVLIDPAAWSAHPLIDIGMLHLFSAPHIETITSAWAQAYPIDDLGADWRERIELHGFFGLFAHAVLFGGGYWSQTRAVAAAYL